MEHSRGQGLSAPVAERTAADRVCPHLSLIEHSCGQGLSAHVAWSTAADRVCPRRSLSTAADTVCPRLTLAAPLGAQPRTESVRACRLESLSAHVAWSTAADRVCPRQSPKPQPRTESVRACRLQQSRGDRVCRTCCFAQPRTGSVRTCCLEHSRGQGLSAPAACSTARVCPRLLLEPPQDLSAPVAWSTAADRFAHSDESDVQLVIVRTVPSNQVLDKAHL